MDAERVAHRVHTLCSTIEALGQEFQDAEAENERARSWAKAWRAAARYWRHIAIDGKDDLDAERAENERLRNIIKATAYALRGTLGKASAQTLLDELGTDND